MKLVIQKVKKAKVEVENKIVGQIEKGDMVLLVKTLIIFHTYFKKKNVWTQMETSIIQIQII